MPRPTKDRVIHDYTAKILPKAMILTLVIFTVVVLVYSLGEKAAVPENAAVALASIVFGFSGLWLLGHLVMYCRGAKAITPPPLPLMGIATGVGATTMAVPSVAQVPQEAVGIAVPPAVLQQQHQQVYRPQNNQYREYQQPNGFPPQLRTHSQLQDQSHREVLPPQQEQQHRSRREDEVIVLPDQREQQERENRVRMREQQQREQQHREQQHREQQQREQQREQQHHRDQRQAHQAEAEAPVQPEQEKQRNHESHRRLTNHKPYVEKPPYPESAPGSYEVPQEEYSKLEQQHEDQWRQKKLQQQQQQQIQQAHDMAHLQENIWPRRPNVPGNQPAPVTVPGLVQQRQQPKGPRTMTGRPPEPPERSSSLQNSLPGTSSGRHRSSSLTSSRFNQSGQLRRGASNRPRPARVGRSEDGTEAVGERGRSRVDRGRPDPYQDIEPEPRSASTRSTSLDSATRASLKVNVAPESWESSSWANSDQPAPLNIAKGDRPPSGYERPIEQSRDIGDHGFLPSRRSSRLESDPPGGGAQGQAGAKIRVPSIQCTPATPPNQYATTVQPAQGEVCDRPPSASASSPSSARSPPPPPPPPSDARPMGPQTFGAMGIPDACESPTLRDSLTKPLALIKRLSKTNFRSSGSDSHRKSSNFATDFQTNVVFMPNYNFAASELLDPQCGENSSLPFLQTCERDEQRMISGEEHADGGDIVVVCSSDDAGQWLVKFVELTESSYETE